MKIKVRPEDFVVKELIDVPISRNGPYTVLKLEKRYWNTLDVIDFVAKRLRVSKRLFSRAGLKDRYSLSTQYLSFKGNLKQVIKEKNFTLTPLGKTKNPVTPNRLIGNAFSIILRNLNSNEIEKIFDNFGQVKNYGIPNYFDEQRFGSARHRKGFFAKELMLKHYKGALKLLLCYPYKEDSKHVKIFKKFCQENWRNWQECFPLTPKNFQRIIQYLTTKPKDYKNAIKKIDKELLNLYLLAYQSYLFNQTLNIFVQRHGDNIIDVPYSMGDFYFYRCFKDLQLLNDLKIPMVNEKIKLKCRTGEAIKSVLKKEGIELKHFTLHKMRFRGVRFKYFLRPAIVTPKNFNLGKPQDDEIYKGKQKLKLRFILSPGSYATLLIKRLLA